MERRPQRAPKGAVTGAGVGVYLSGLLKPVLSAKSHLKNSFGSVVFLKNCVVEMSVVVGVSHTVSDMFLQAPT